jgi:hypothetical protein
LALRAADSGARRLIGRAAAGRREHAKGRCLHAREREKERRGEEDNPAAKPAAARGELLDLWDGLGQPTLANSVAQIHHRSAEYRSERALGKRNGINETPSFSAFVDFSERFRRARPPPPGLPAPRPGCKMQIARLHGSSG